MKVYVTGVRQQLVELLLIGPVGLVTLLNEERKKAACCKSSNLKRPPNTRCPSPRRGSRGASTTSLDVGNVSAIGWRI